MTQHQNPQIAKSPKPLTIWLCMLMFNTLWKLCVVVEIKDRSVHVDYAIFGLLCVVVEIMI